MDSDLYISHIFPVRYHSTAEGYVECSLVKLRKLLAPISLLAKYDFM